MECGNRSRYAEQSMQCRKKYSKQKICAIRINERIGNIALGIESQRNLKEGSYNIGLGTDTMYSSETAFNIAVGYDSLHDNINRNDNVSIG